MSTVQFLAPVPGLAANTVYAPGSVQTLDGQANEATLRQLQRDGKVSLNVADVRNVRVSAVAATTATLAFTTDQPASTMRADYGVGAALNLQQAATPANGVGDIVVNLTGLTTATSYSYRILINAVAPLTGYTYSGVYTFTTL